MGTQPFVIERVFDAPVEKVWQAITNKDQMKQWYFDLNEFRPEIGFEFQFAGQGKDGNTEYIHLCEITEVIVQKKLTYSWRYKGLNGTSYVTFELFPENNKTRLKLTHRGLETFITDNPDFAKKNFAEGWTYIIGTSLDKFLKSGY